MFKVRIELTIESFFVFSEKLFAAEMVARRNFSIFSRFRAIIDDTDVR